MDGSGVVAEAAPSPADAMGAAGLSAPLATEVAGASDGGSLTSLVSPEDAAASAEAAGAPDVRATGGLSDDAGAGLGGSHTALEQANKSLALPAAGPLRRKPVSCDASVSNNHTNAFFISSGCRILSANARPSGF